MSPKKIIHKWNMKEILVRVAVDWFGEESRKTNPIGSSAFIRECIERFKNELSRDDGLLDEISEQPDEYTFDQQSKVRDDYWMSLATWSSAEAAHLAIGRDPDDRSPVKQIDKKRIEDYERATMRFLTVKPRATAIDIYEYLSSFSLARFPEEISNHFNGIIENDPKNRYKVLYKNLRDEVIENGEHKYTLLKLIYALGNVPYNFTPDKNNEAASAISKKIIYAGMTLSVITIRKQLKAAHDYHLQHAKHRPSPSRKERI